MNRLLLSYRSLENRKSSVYLTVFSIAISTVLILGVLKLSTGLEQSFMKTISGTDLIVGAKTSQENLLLSNVFDIGSPTEGISQSVYWKWKYDTRVKWIFPWAMGDSHKGFRVIGTNNDCFTFFKFGDNQSLSLAKGEYLNSTFDILLGGEVAEKLHYTISDTIYLSHGRGEHSFHDHDEDNFVIKGILNKTGTSIDGSIFTTISALDEIHKELNHGAIDPLFASEQKPQSKISTLFIGLKNRSNVLAVQQQIKDYKQESLTAIIPALTVVSLWDSLSLVKQSLVTISFVVFVTSVIGVVSMLLSLLNERRKEMALLRSLGASAMDVFSLILFESFIICMLGVLFGEVLLMLIIFGFNNHLIDGFHLVISFDYISMTDLVICLFLVFLGTLSGIIPAIRAYKNTLSDGLKTTA